MKTLFSESVVFHLVFWVSSFVVLFWVVLVFGFVLLRLWKASGFLLFTCSRTTVRIDDRRQDVLMTVRALSVHGMSKKKTQSKCGLATHLKTYAGLAEACWYEGQRQEQSRHIGSGQLHSGNK